MSEISSGYAEDYSMSSTASAAWDDNADYASVQDTGPKGWSSHDTIESLAPNKAQTSEQDARKQTVSLGAVGARLKQMLGLGSSASGVVAAAVNAPSHGQVLSEQLQLTGQDRVEKGLSPLQIGGKNVSYVSDAVDEVSNWAQWLWDKVNPYGSSTSSSNHTDDEEIQRFNKDGTANPFAGRRQALSPEERIRFRQQVKEMNQLLDRMRELLDDDQFELLMALIIQESMRSRDEAASLVQQQMLNTYKKRMKLNKERLAEAQDYVKAAQSYAWWGQFEDWASSIGLTLAATSAAGSGGWGVVALCYVLGTQFNRWHGNPVESAIAKAVGAGAANVGADRKSVESTCFDTVRVGSGVFNLLVTFGFSGTSTLGTMMEGAMQLVNVHVKTKCDRSEGRLFKLDHELQKEQRTIGGQIKKMGGELEKKVKDQKRSAQLAQKQEEISRGLFR